MEEREADYKASRSLCWVTENLRDWSAEALFALSVSEKFTVHEALGLGESILPSLSETFLPVMGSSQGQMKCRILVDLKERWGVNPDSRRILLPPWYLFGGFCQPFLLQLSCQITHSLGSPKCFGILRGIRWVRGNHMPSEMKVLKFRRGDVLIIWKFFTFFFEKRKLNHLNMEQIPLFKVEYFE